MDCVGKFFPKCELLCECVHAWCLAMGWRPIQGELLPHHSLGSRLWIELNPDYGINQVLNVSEATF